ncbi:MAG: hypothetical protein ACI83I_002078 [Bacteroidia bacterium]|jgi:hypothetical protein
MLNRSTKTRAAQVIREVKERQSIWKGNEEFHLALDLNPAGGITCFER